MKSVALVALPLALAAQLIWILLSYFVEGISHINDIYMPVTFIGFAAMAATRGQSRELSMLLRVFLGVTFLLAVADRFGLLGTPGSPGISWGDWSHFVADTRQINAFLPSEFAPTLAVLATLAELSLGLTLLLGMRARQAAAGAVLLLVVYASAMTFSLGPLSPFPYSVYVLAAGAWVLATVDTSVLSLDAVLARRQRARRVSLAADFPRAGQ